MTINVKEYIDENYPDKTIPFLYGLDEAFIGVGFSFNKPYACYDKGKIIDLLMSDGMTEEEALEYFEFNIAGSYMGQRMPIIIDMVKEG